MVHNAELDRCGVVNTQSAACDHELKPNPPAALLLRCRVWCADCPFCPLLLLRPKKDVGALVPMGFLHAVSHLTVVLGLGAGAVSFLQTVKASEACFTALLSYLFLGQVRHSSNSIETQQHSSESLFEKAWLAAQEIGAMKGGGLSHGDISGLGCGAAFASPPCSSTPFFDAYLARVLRDSIRNHRHARVEVTAVVLASISTSGADIRCRKQPTALQLVEVFPSRFEVS